MSKVSIIVPVYNVEDYMSLKEPTNYDIQNLIKKIEVDEGKKYMSIWHSKH